ncbi:MAG: nucleotidyltransferase family protein, partial [Lewinella sp.]|nr:nucleotidyltransferase family protein [Lewinella sp.]
MSEYSITHLLLAAGASTRMGRPKQLLNWRGQSLIRHSVQNIQKAELAERIVVVLGAKQEEIVPELNDLNVEVVVNSDWESGMGSSIRCGVEYALQDAPNGWEGIFISLVDQPLVQAAHYQEIFQVWREHFPAVVAAQYNGILGVPALFGQPFFSKLLQLNGAVGARKILAQAEGVIPVSIPEAVFDLDTPEDYE